MPRVNTQIDFWNNVDQSAGSGHCWPWTRSRSPKGYGKTFFFGKDWRAHRLAYYFTHGSVPGLVCHRCDNPPCCNPSHLFAGDHSVNALDRAQKKRGFMPKGELHHHAKLTAEDVIRMRQLYAKGGWSYSRLGLMFGLHSCSIGQIIRRERWAHL